MFKSKMALRLISLVLAISIAGNVWLYNKLLAIQADATNLFEQLSAANEKNSALQTELDVVVQAQTSEEPAEEEVEEPTAPTESQTPEVSEPEPDTPEETSRQEEQWQKDHATSGDRAPATKFADMSEEKKEQLIQALMDALGISREEAIELCIDDDKTTQSDNQGNLGPTGGNPSPIWG